MKAIGIVLLCFVLISLAFGGDDLYDYGRSPVVQLTEANFKETVLNSNETWFVEFYAPWCGHCRNLVPAWEKAAEHLKGIVNFGGVNCDEHKSIAGKYGVSGFPTIKVFKGTGARARRPTEYQGDRSAKALVERAKSEIPNHVVEIKAGGIDSFLEDEAQMPHVILFTDKSSTSPIYKALSAAFLGKVSVGEIRKKEAEAIKSKFDVSSYPTFISFPARANGDAGVKYNGPTDPASLRRFIGNLIGQPGPGSDSGDDLHEASAEDAEQKKTFYQPTEHEAVVGTVTDGDVFQRLCWKRLDSATCIAAFINAPEQSEKVAELLHNLSVKYRYDNFGFVSIDVSEGGPGLETAEAMDLDLSSGVALVAIRGRRSKYAPLILDEVTQTAVGAFLDRILSGDVQYKKISDLPTWPGPPAPEHEEESSSEGSGDAETNEAEDHASESKPSEETARSFTETDDETAKEGRGHAKEFGCGSANDPQLHPGDKCESDAENGTDLGNAEKEEL